MMKTFFVISLCALFFMATACQVKEGSQSGALIAGHIPTESNFTLSLPTNGTRTTGEELVFVLTHPYNVTVSGTPRLTLTIGADTRYATYQSGSGSRNLVFAYTIVSGENASSGIGVLDSVDLNGGTLSFTGTQGTESCNLNFSVSSTSNIKVDALAPTVNTITPPSNGTYRFGMPLRFQVAMTEKVIITGTPRLTLTIGATTRYASLTSNTSSSIQSLVFTYFPDATDIDTNGIAIAATIDLNGGTMKDEVGLDAVLTFALPATAGILVDANTPYVVSVTPPTNGNYGSGDVLDFVVNYSETMIITGIPSFNLNINGVNRAVAYYSGSNSSQITFRYVIQPGEVDSNGLTSGTTFTMTGATIRDMTGVNAVNGFVMPSLSQIFIVDNRPAIASFLFNAGTYYIGETLSFTALFNEPVTITGSPQIALTLDSGGPVMAQYVSGSGTENIVFRYTVAEGTNDANGVVITTPLALNGGTIQSANAVNANLVFTQPNTGTLLINGIRPTVTNITGPVAGTYTTGTNLNFAIQFSEVVNVHSSGNVRLDIQVGLNARQATYLSGNGSTILNFRYTVAAGDSSPDGISFTGFALTGAGAIKDGTPTQANNADLTFVAPDLSGVLLNVTTPNVSGVTPPIDDVYILSEQLNFDLQFSEDVVVTGTPRLALTIGGATQYAQYVSGSGSSNLIFRYTVQSGDEDTDGISSSTFIDLNGGTIKGLAEGNATLTVPVQALEGVMVDGIVPSISSITNPINNTYTIADTTLTFTVTWNDDVTVGGTPYLELDIGGVTRQANYTAGSTTDTLTFSYTLDADDLDLDGIGLNAMIQLSGGSIEDASGNPASLNVGAQNLSKVLVNFPDMISWWDVDYASHVSTAVCGAATCVTQISDRSGNNKHITASGAARPEYRSSGFAGGNRAHLQFDNINMVMTVVGSLTQARTVFIVFQTEVAAMSDQDLLYQDGLTIYVRAGSTGTTRYGVVATSSLNARALTAPASVHAAGLKANTPYILAVKYNIAYNFSTPFVGSTNFGGKIAEILIYNSDLSADQISKVQSYLNLKHQVH